MPHRYIDDIHVVPGENLCHASGKRVKAVYRHKIFLQHISLLLARLWLKFGYISLLISIFAFVLLVARVQVTIPNP